MCIWAAQQNREGNLQFFLFLKLIYPAGKTKFTQNEIHAIASMMNFADIRPVKKHIKELIELKWIKHNQSTGYFILRSFDQIRRDNNWESRTCVQATLDDLNKISAFIGATLYTYLHKDFWRKVKKEKSVCLRGRAYHFLSPSFNFSKHSAPISIEGVEQLFNISKTKASKLKHLAKQAGYIEVFPDYQETILNDATYNSMQKSLDLYNHLVFKKGKNTFCAQLTSFYPKSTYSSDINAEYK